MTGRGESGRSATLPTERRRVNLEKLRVNQLSAEGWDWYQRYLAVLDAYDLDGYAEFLADDVAIQFNNEEPMVGREQAKAGLGQFWGAISGMGYSLLHEPLNIYGTDASACSRR